MLSNIPIFQPDVDAHIVMWKLALGWALLSVVVLILVAILLDVFGLRRLDEKFRGWIYGTFLVGLLSGVSGWFFDVIKVSPQNAARDVAPSALDANVSRAFVPPPAAPPPPALPSAAIDRSAYKVFVQFAGILRREDVIRLSQTLAAEGWNTQGRDRGGERTAAAAGYNEVRCSSADVAAARALAASVQGQNLTSKAVTVVETASVKPGNLEVWISR